MHAAPTVASIAHRFIDDVNFGYHHAYIELLVQVLHFRSRSLSHTWPMRYWPRPSGSPHSTGSITALWFLGRDVVGTRKKHKGALCVVPKARLLGRPGRCGRIKRRVRRV